MNKLFSITVYKEGQETGNIIHLDQLSPCGDFILRKIKSLETQAMFLGCNFRYNLEKSHGVTTGAELYWDNNGIDRTHRIVVQEYKSS